jgi:glycosyltransferase involved in cell wall biosynthesis
MDSVMQDPVLSVVIPAFNAARFIGSAIDSILDQDIRMDFEILAVDDGSSDSTAAVVEGYGEKVRCIRQANGGPGSARNAGVLAARGCIVMLLDADDLAMPGWVEKQAAFMLEQPDIDVCFGSMLRQGNPDVDYLEEYGLDTEGDGFVRMDRPFEKLLVCGNFVPTSGTCVRRRTYISAGLQSTRRTLAEDYELWCRIAALKGNFAYVARPLVWYRQENQGNLMNTAYAYTGAVEAMHRLLMTFGGDLPKPSYRRAHRRFLRKVEMLLRYEWSYRGPRQVALRLRSLAPLIPSWMAWKWRGVSLVPGAVPRSAHWVLVSLRQASGRRLCAAPDLRPQMRKARLTPLVDDG